MTEVISEFQNGVHTNVGLLPYKQIPDYRNLVNEAWDVAYQLQNESHGDHFTNTSKIIRKIVQRAIAEKKTPEQIGDEYRSQMGHLLGNSKKIPLESQPTA